MFDLILLGIFILWCGLLFLFYMDKTSDNVWFCEKLDWHKAPTQQGFDGASMHGTCPRCKNKVLQDSQGNWFKCS